MKKVSLLDAITRVAFVIGVLVFQIMFFDAVVKAILSGTYVPEESEAAVVYQSTDAEV